jgi:hypothetical protein
MNHPVSGNCQIITAALLACALSIQTPITLAGTGFGEDTVNIRLGAFLSDFDTQVALKGPAGNGMEVDLEDALGLEPDQLSFRGDLMWRFAPRHRVILGYYSFDRSNSGTVQQDFTWEFTNGDQIDFTVGTAVNSTFDWTLVPVSYAYSFYKTDKLELAGQLGIHWFDLSVGVAGDANVNGGTVTTFVAESESASGPLPVFGPCRLRTYPQVAGWWAPAVFRTGL